LKYTLQIAPMSTVVDISVGLRPGGTVEIGTTPRPLIESPVEPQPTAAVLSTSSPDLIPTTGQLLPIRVGGNIQAGSLISHPNPVYPSEARLKGIEGVVILSGAIGEDGHLRNLKIASSSNPLLETSVLDTIQNWTYRPSLLNGQPVEVLTTITLNFTFSR
jgi:TonB family protein